MRGDASTSWPGPRRLAALCLAALFVIVLASPAGAHEDEESTTASVLVRQGIALIVNTPDGTMAIEDKITDALESRDTDGVNVALVRQAATELEEGNLHRVRALLEVSIGARPHMSGLDVQPVGETAGPVAGSDVETAVRLATGEASGTNVVIDPLSARRQFDAGTWLALASMVALAAAGVGLAIRFRPPVSIRGLRASQRTEP